MDDEVLLPSSDYINTTLGLKYLNANKKLYIKVLNSFLLRYQYFDINSLKEHEIKSEMHTLKGLSSTLGMEYLSTLAKDLHREKNEKNLLEFIKVLQVIINDLSNTQNKTLLIMDDNSDDIDNLIELFADSHDIIIATTSEDAQECLSNEIIDIVLLNPKFDIRKTKHKLEQKNISIFYLEKPIELNNLLLAIKNFQI